MADGNGKGNVRRYDHEVLIVGTGFAGLGLAIRLKQEGSTDFVVLEKADDVGGTWRDNHYPGCACDVQSHLYSFSFEPNPRWSRMFAPQQEILEYLRHCARKYGILPHVRFGSFVCGARFDEAAGVWHVEVADGRAMQAYLEAKGLKLGDPVDLADPAFPPRRTVTAKVLVSGMGGLSTPAYPKLPGLERFEGTTFHSQSWNHDYPLEGKRVAVIGTGASAIQFVPQIQPKVARLDLYQRTPPWIMPKPDRAMTAREQELFRAVPVTQTLLRGGIYTFLETRAIAFTLRPEIMKAAEALARGYLARKVKDPVLRAKLTPDYTLGCKRVLISRDYYPALTQPNVDVITTGIREVRARSIVTTDGVEREVDAIIFGTGFQANDPIPRGVVFGTGGRDLLDAWKDGPEAYKGTTVSGFPNFFLIVGPNTGLGHSSMVYMIESQIAYVLDALRTMRERNLKSIDVRADVQADFNRDLQEKAQRAIWSVGGCQSWYLHPSGKNVTLWPEFTFSFRYKTRKFDVERYVAEPIRATVPR